MKFEYEGIIKKKKTLLWVSYCVFFVLWQDFCFRQFFTFSHTPWSSLVGNYPSRRLFLKGQWSSQHISPLNPRCKNPRIGVLKSCWGYIRQIWAFSFSCPKLTHDHVAHLPLPKLIHLFFFLTSHMQINIYLPPVAITVWHYALLSLYPRKARGSKYVPIWWLWNPQRGSYLLHSPFLMCIVTHKGSLISRVSEKLLVWWRKCISGLSLGESSQPNWGRFAKSSVSTYISLNIVLFMKEMKKITLALVSLKI